MTTPPTANTEAAKRSLTLTEWLICGVAALGFAFDIYELLMLPLIVRPALLELSGVTPGTPEFNTWVGLLFYVPALAGGVFGLLGGYLTDLFGRRRVLVWSILLYAFSAFAAAFSTSPESKRIAAKKLRERTNGEVNCDSISGSDPLGGSVGRWVANPSIWRDDRAAEFRVHHYGRPIVATCRLLRGYGSAHSFHG